MVSIISMILKQIRSTKEICENQSGKFCMSIFDLKDYTDIKQFCLTNSQN